MAKKETKRCLMSYEVIRGNRDYAPAGLKRLHRHLTHLDRLQYTSEQQLQENIAKDKHLSPQLTQPRLSAVLRIKGGCFEIVDRGGKFILKPPNRYVLELAENEDLTMRLANAAGIEVPLHGLIRTANGVLTYFMKRFDREGRKKHPVEDFAQLSGRTRTTKYGSTMETVANVVDNYCTFPMVERVNLFKRVLFSFLVGNDDLHLKNFSLITRNGKVSLAPAHDLTNTTVTMRDSDSELALTLNGKRSEITADDLLGYYGQEVLQINDTVMELILDEFVEAFPVWDEWIEKSFLSEIMKMSYRSLIIERRKRLGIWCEMSIPKMAS